MCNRSVFGNREEMVYLLLYSNSTTQSDSTKPMEIISKRWLKSVKCNTTKHVLSPLVSWI